MSMKAHASNWWRFAARNSNGRFGTALGLRLKEDGGDLRIISIGEKESLVVLDKLPDWFYHDKEKGEVRLSALIATFDEVSTYAGTTCWDKSGRPGVSIQLSGRKIRPLNIPYGGGICIRTTKRKAGKTLAFLDISVTDNKNQEIPLVRGKHIKFMEMGGALTTMTKLAKTAAKFRVSQHLLELGQVHENISNLTLNDLFPFEYQIESSDLNGRAIIQKNLSNPVSNMHGGAATVLASLLAESLIPDNLCSISSITLNLLSAVPVSKTVELKSKQLCDEGIILSEILVGDSIAADCSIRIK